MRGLRKAVLLLTAAFVLCVCTGGTAESMHRVIPNDALDIRVEVGYNGVMTYGKVMPVTVRIRNFGDDFEGVLAMNAYVSSKQYDRLEREIALPAGAEREFTLPLTVYARQDTYTAEIVKDGKVICSAGAKPSEVANPSAMLVGVLSTRPQNLNNLNIDPENDRLARYEFWKTIPLTADNFPEDLTMLKSFGMLVIDDFDPAALSEKQCGTLDAWIRSGRFLICGGGANAARTTAFFSGYTGLSLDGVTSSGSVLEGLERMLRRTVSGKTTTSALAEYSGAEPLGTDTEEHGLVYRSTAGAGRIYTAAFETGDPKLNSEDLMRFFWQQLLIDFDQDLYSSVIYANAGSNASAAVGAGEYLEVNARSQLLPGILITAGMLALACAVWWILKKKDLRQWMWLALPVLAVLASAGLLLLSSGSETNKPMAVVAENIIQDASGSVRSYCGISAAAPSYGRHSYSADGESIAPQNYDYVDYGDEENDKKRTEPDELRTCYTLGGMNTVNVESRHPWETVNLTVEKSVDLNGSVNGVIWMESDGLHGEIVNGTGVKLSAGPVITTYGYASIPALAPGEKAGFALKKSRFADPEKPVFKDGCMYAESTGLYMAVYAAVGYTDDMLFSGSREERDRSMTVTMINNAADMLRRAQEGWSYGSYEGAMFIYCAKPEKTWDTNLAVDGKPVEKQADAVLLTTELRYETIGRTGVVFRSTGMDIPVRVETDQDGLPGDEPVQNGKNLYYHTLNESPTFRFTIEGLDGVKVDTLQVLVNSYYSTQCTLYALNAESRAWEEIPLNGDVKDPGRYLDGDGRLYIQFRTGTQDMYADIATPLITLEGRLENADH